MASNKDILRSALAGINANKNAEINARQNKILNEEVNPKIVETRKKFDEAWQAARAEMEQENKELIADGKARAEAEVEAEYAVMLDGIQKLIGE